MYDWRAHFEGDASVAEIQSRLNALGANPPLVVDGVSGAKTKAAIIAFQQSRGLTPDGVVGPQTSAALGLSGAGPTTTAAPTSTVAALTAMFGDLLAFAQRTNQTVVQAVGLAPGFEATKASVVSSFVPWSEPFEGYTDFPYTDAHGLVTTGMGNLLDALAPGQVMGQNCGHGTNIPCGQATPTSFALSLPWEGGDINADWAAIKQAWPGVSSVACRDITSCRLPRAAVEKLVAEKLAENERALVANLPGYTTAPADAQLAAHSMSWAMGTGFASTWPKFREAFGKKDFVTAANESHMQGVGIDMRNMANKLLLINADTVTKKGLNPERLLYLDGLALATTAAVGLGGIFLVVGGVLLWMYRGQIFGV